MRQLVTDVLIQTLRLGTCRLHLDKKHAIILLTRRLLAQPGAGNRSCTVMLLQIADMAVSWNLPPFSTLCEGRVDCYGVQGMQTC